MASFGAASIQNPYTLPWDFPDRRRSNLGMLNKVNCKKQTWLLTLEKMCSISFARRFAMNNLERLRPRIHIVEKTWKRKLAERAQNHAVCMSQRPKGNAHYAMFGQVTCWPKISLRIDICWVLNVASKYLLNLKLNSMCEKKVTDLCKFESIQKKSVKTQCFIFHKTSSCNNTLGPSFRLNAYVQN
jgi:hypothetical protein